MTTLPIFRDAYLGDWGHGDAPIIAIGEALTTAVCAGARGLIKGDEPDAAMSWAGSQWRLPMHGVGPVRSVAVNVKVTGRSVQRRSDCRWVRAQIEFVGHCEPSTFVAGWVRWDRLTVDAA